MKLPCVCNSPAEIALAHLLDGGDGLSQHSNQVESSFLLQRCSHWQRSLSHQSWDESTSAVQLCGINRASYRLEQSRMRPPPPTKLHPADQGSSGRHAFWDRSFPAFCGGRACRRSSSSPYSSGAPSERIFRFRGRCVVLSSAGSAEVQSGVNRSCTDS